LCQVHINYLKRGENIYKKNLGEHKPNPVKLHKCVRQLKLALQTFYATLMIQPLQ